MILIAGTSLSSDDLPMSELLEYVVVYDINSSELNIKMKTVANRSDCIRVYLPTGYENKDISEMVKPKCVFFENDDDLLALLENGGDELGNDLEKEDDAVEPVEQEVVVFNNNADYDISKLHEDEDLDTVYDFEEDTLTEVDADIDDDFLIIPNIAEDVDSLKITLNSKDRIIEQKNLQIEELRRSRDDIFSIQEGQLNELRLTYEAKINEALEEINTLTSQLEATNMDEFTANFLKFATYSRKYSVLLKDGLSAKEQESLGGKELNNMFVYACAGGDSYFSLMRKIKELTASNPKIVIADFSSTPYLGTLMGLKELSPHSMHLNDDDVGLEAIVRDFGNVKLCPTKSFNDIALLGVDWGKVLRKLNEYAGGYPVILLFNNINDFNVRYTVSKLSTVCPLFIFTTCNPVILTSLSTDIKFLPEHRFRIVAWNYITEVKGGIDKISATSKVIVFKTAIDWKTLGLKLKK